MEETLWRESVVYSDPILSNRYVAARGTGMAAVVGKGGAFAMGPPGARMGGEGFNVEASKAKWNAIETAR